MEAGIGEGLAPAPERRATPRWSLAIVLGLALLLRLPFLNQAVQGDDDLYFTAAAHAQVDPLHPNSGLYIFRGEAVDMRGHSHPPMNAWWLAVLIAAFGQVREIPFHLAYSGFSLLAAWAMWKLARRFSPQPLWAALLFLAVPAFVVNGNSFESDLPFLAFWMTAVALFVDEDSPSRVRLLLSALAMAIMVMTAYQGVFLTPILAAYLLLNRRRDAFRWGLIFTAPVVICAWQVFERLTTGAAPAAVLSGFFSSYGFQAIAAKLQSAVMLFIHSWFIVFPALVPAAFALAWRKRREPETAFLLAWIGLFFAGAVVVFFAGSARYLLPMAAPVALLASRLPSRWLVPAFAAQLALGLGLAAVNYQHWKAYRDFAGEIRGATAGSNVWVDGEWGLRHYMEEQGARPLTKGQPLRAGDVIVSNELGAAVHPTGEFALIAQAEIRPRIPFRLIGLETHSGYSTVSLGYWPFGISAGVIDRITAAKVTDRHPTAEFLPMNSPDAEKHILSGIFPLENGAFRWMSQAGALALKNPAQPLPILVAFSIPDSAPARRITVLLDGREVASQSYPKPGGYTLRTQPLRGAGQYVTLEIRVDKTFTAPPDTRALGIVLTRAGFSN